jgi:hypothetical protein
MFCEARWVRVPEEPVADSTVENEHATESGATRINVQFANHPRTDWEGRRPSRKPELVGTRLRHLNIIDREHEAMIYACNLSILGPDPAFTRMLGLRQMQLFVVM